MIVLSDRRSMDSILTPVQQNSITADAFVRHSILNHNHVAVVYSCKTDRLLASGTNAALLHEHCSIHAEAAAIAQFRKRVRDHVVKRSDLSKGVAVLSLRVSKEGHLRNAKPCVRCRQAVLQCCPVVRRLEWSDEDESIVVEKL